MKFLHTRTTRHEIASHVQNFYGCPDDILSTSKHKKTFRQNIRKIVKMNVKPAFSFSIDMKLSEKGCAVGKYDGKHASLTAITQSNKVKILILKINQLSSQIYFR